MASAPQFYSDYTIFPTEFYDQAPSALVQAGGNEEINKEVDSLFDEFGLQDQIVSSSDQHCQPLSTIHSSYPPRHQYEVPETNMISTCGIAAGYQNLCAGYQPHQFYEFGDECFGLVPDFSPVYHPVASENSETQINQAAAIEDSSMKVSRYSEEVRKERILRYLKKRNQRNFNKTIKYACRKTLADRRVRVRGRFARNSEPCDQEIIPQNSDTHKDTDPEFYNVHNTGEQMKKDEEEWLEEIRSLMYLPYITSS